MTSKRKKANKRNALKSTGPKTSEGKAVSRYNALSHGVLAREILLPGEDKGLLEELETHLVHELEPSGTVERLLVDRIVSAAWRLRRIMRAEAGEVSRNLIAGPASNPESLGLAYVRASQPPDTLTKLNRYEVTIERSLFRSLHELERLQAARNGENVPPPAALDVTLTVGRESRGAETVTVEAAD